VRVLLDTTFLLPLFGIKVQGIDEDRLIALRRALKEHGVGVAYPKLLIAELIAKMGKEASRRGGLPSEALEALEALLLEVDIELIEPSVEHIATAVEMRVRGHRDVFDNLLYATALHEGMKLVTEDEGLVGFLRDNNYRTDLLARLEDVERGLASGR
jgi:predicted nucleic acid-binding protein